METRVHLFMAISAAYLDTLIAGTGGHPTAIEIIADVVNQVLMVCTNRFSFKHAGWLTFHSAVQVLVTAEWAIIRVLHV